MKKHTFRQNVEVLSQKTTDSFDLGPQKFSIIHLEKKVGEKSVHIHKNTRVHHYLIIMRCCSLYAILVTSIT